MEQKAQFMVEILKEMLFKTGFDFYA